MTVASLTLLLQEAAPQEPAAAGGEFHPFLPGLVVLLPLLGFLLNGTLALIAASRSADAVRAGSEWKLPDTNRPATHTLPSLIGPGVLGLAFVIVLVNFVRLLGAGAHEPVVVDYYTW